MVTEEKGFNVICTNPAKSASIEACWFSSTEWTEEEAKQAFASDYGLEMSEVEVETED